jgi:hypothetical protein
MTKNQILNSVISDLQDIPLPKDGKSVGAGTFVYQLKEAFRLARFVQWSTNIEEMELAYKYFKEHIRKCSL